MQSERKEEKVVEVTICFQVFVLHKNKKKLDKEIHVKIVSPLEVSLFLFEEPGI
jgi:pyruvate carboxylase